MENKEFFGSDDPGTTAKPSVLSVVVGQCVDEFSPYYHPAGGDEWNVASDGANDCELTDAEVAGDISAWVRDLSGEGDIGAKIVTLVKGNPGWEKIVARRVMKELRQWTR